MPQQTPGQARLIDPILSGAVQGYTQADLVGNALFPRVPVGVYGGQVIEFGKEAFRRYSTRRAPGSATKRVSFGYAGKPYSIQSRAIEIPIPRELDTDARAVPGIDLGRRAGNMGMRIHGVDMEYMQAELATDADNYDSDHKVALTGADRWTHGDSTPSVDIETGREAIRASAGVYPNVALLSAKAMSALRHHPRILDRIKHTSRDSVTAELLAGLWEIPRVVVGSGVLATGQGDVFSDIWGTDVVLAYVAPSPIGPEEPSYGYTYFINGHPLVETPYWEKRNKSWIYGVSDDAEPVLSGMTSGYLIENAGAPHGT